MARGRTAYDETENDADRSNTGFLLPRRSYLTLAGVTAGALGGVGAARAAAPEADYDRVVDVTEAGADPSGREPVDDVLAEHVADDTLVRFPDGRYRVSGQAFDGLHNVALVGRDATLIPDDGSTEFLTFTGVRDLVVDGFTTDPTAGAATLSVHAAGGRTVVRDYAVAGRLDEGTALEIAAAHGARLDVAGARLADGGGGVGIAAVSPTPSGAEGDGALVLEDCVVEGWTDGLAVSDHGGSLHVLGGRYANSSRAQVRVRGGPEMRAAMREAAVVVDDPGPDARTVSGVRFEAGDELTVADSDVWLADLDGATGTAAVVHRSEAGRLAVLDSRIRTDAAVGGIDSTVASDGDDSEATSGSLVCRNVSLTGGAGGGAAVRVVGRDGTTLAGLCVEQSGEDRTGLLVVDAEDVTVSDCAVDVTGRATVFVDSSVVATGVSGAANCSAPDVTAGRVADGDSDPDRPRDRDPSKPSAEPLAHVVQVVAHGGDPVSYAFSVDGRVAHAGDPRVGENVYGKTVESAVDGGSDAYAFAGRITDFRWDGGDVTVLVDGVEVDASDVDEERPAAPSAGDGVPSRFVADGTNGERGPSSYVLAAGGVTAVDGSGSGATDRVSGTVDGGADAFEFEGPVGELRLDGTGVVNLRRP